MRAQANQRSKVALLLSACAAAPACAERKALPTPPAAASAPSTEFAEGPGPLPRYHSKRLGLSLPLPDGRGWKIDDHSRAELVATHAPTRSRVLVAVIRSDDLVGRTQCEQLALAGRLVPSGELTTLEDQIATTQGTFDTRIRVALEIGAAPPHALVGHVMAFGGFLRKCLVFDFSTQVDTAAQEPALATRLAFARARILDGLELDSFATVPRDVPAPAVPRP